jgi:hypothetical protein
LSAPAAVPAVPSDPAVNKPLPSLGTPLLFVIFSLHSPDPPNFYFIASCT